MAGMYLVKKYANRKLYDTVERRYVTLEVIADLVAHGNDVQVVDQVSGADITTATMTLVAGGAGSAPRRSGGRRPQAARRQRQANATSVKGRAGPLAGILRASLTLPAALGQRAVAEISQRTSLDTVLRRGPQIAPGSLADQVAELRAEVELLSSEVERLHGELAELRPVRNGVLN